MSTDFTKRACYDFFKKTYNGNIPEIRTINKRRYVINYNQSIRIHFCFLIYAMFILDQGLTEWSLEY